jgi:hypothetical protein
MVLKPLADKAQSADDRKMKSPDGVPEIEWLINSTQLAGASFWRLAETARRTLPLVRWKPCVRRIGILCMRLFGAG